MVDSIEPRTYNAKMKVSQENGNKLLRILIMSSDCHVLRSAPDPVDASCRPPSNFYLADIYTHHAHGYEVQYLRRFPKICLEPWILPLRQVIGKKGTDSEREPNDRLSTKFFLRRTTVLGLCCLISRSVRSSCPTS